uniref:Uncharacterized protein n=1 Tax=Panagrolaimus davidi TaxID=227884 RepID=A0A914QAI1_9BILA
MVQTRSRTSTYQSKVVEGAPKPSRSKSEIGGKSSSHSKAKEVSRKRGLQQNDETLSTPALKKSRPNAKKTADKPKAKQRTRSVSKPRTIHREVREKDVKESIEKPQSMRTQSRSRSRSVYHEVCEEEEPDVTPKKEDIPPDADQILSNADASMITPENHNTSDEMKEVALRKSHTIEHYSTAYPYTPRRYIDERMGHSRWSHHYYDSQFKDPMILCSDRLYDDDDEFLFEQDEIDKESILPTPTSSLDTSSVSSEDDIKYSRPKEAKSAEKKESTSFFKNFCSVM